MREIPCPDWIDDSRVETKEWIKHGTSSTALMAMLSLDHFVGDVEDIETEFQREAEVWAKETAHLSSPQQRFQHPSYTTILEMAKDNRYQVIRLMLEDMQANRREWFWALKALTHENPVDQKDSGYKDKMISAWVRWGRRQGYEI
jgi:hypothetical protein